MKSMNSDGATRKSACPPLQVGNKISEVILSGAMEYTRITQPVVAHVGPYQCVIPSTFSPLKTCFREKFYLP